MPPSPDLTSSGCFDDVLMFCEALNFSYQLPAPPAPLKKRAAHPAHPAQAMQLSSPNFTIAPYESIGTGIVAWPHQMLGILGYWMVLERFQGPISPHLSTGDHWGLLGGQEMQIRSTDSTRNHRLVLGPTQDHLKTPVRSRPASTWCHKLPMFGRVHTDSELCLLVVSCSQPVSNNISKHLEA